MGAFIDMTGKQVGDWLVIERAESVRRKRVVVTRWLCHCTLCGAEKVVEGNNLRAGRSQRCRRCSARPGAPRKAVVTYHGQHERIRRERGRAATHPCVDCGQQAAHWSLDEYRDDDVIGEHNGSPARYSLDVARYVPRCVANGCHYRHDAQQRAAITTNKGAQSPCRQPSASQS